MKTVVLTVLATGIAFAQAPPPPPPPPAAAPASATACAVVSPAAAKLEFDAASVKPAGPFQPGGRGGFGGFGGGPGSNDPTRVSGMRVTLGTLIMQAWGLQVDELIGPAWMNDAVNNGFAVTATMPDGITKEQYCGMLRNLVLTRFHVTFHHDTQSRAGYELTLLPGGPKFKKYDPKDPGPEAGDNARADKNGFPLMPPDRPSMLAMSMSPTGLRKTSFRNDFSLFVRSLWADISESQGRGGLGNPLARVTDKTGLTGVYDIRLEFAGTPFNVPGAARDQGTGAATAPDPGEGPNIFTAVQQQLGLKLTKVKDVPVDVLIIDHADQTPTEN